MDWQDAFETANIPPNRIIEAFETALKNHDSGFPVNAFEIVAAYKQIRIDESFGIEANQTKDYLRRVLYAGERQPMPQSVEDALAEMKRKQA